MWFAIVGKRTFHGTTGLHPLADAEPLAAEEERLVLAEAERGRELRPLAVRLDPALVRDLAASVGIERRLAQLGEEGAVADLLERADLRQHLRLLPADELRFEARIAGEVTRALELALLASRTRDLAMLLHQPLEAVLVDGEPPLARELDGQLDREAVRRREREGVLAGDVAARRDVFEELHAAGERLGEAFLLRAQRLADLSRFASSSGYHWPICSTTTSEMRQRSSSPIFRACWTARRMTRRST